MASAGMKGMVLLAMTAVALLTTGCFDPPKEAEERLAQTKADGEKLLKQFDGLEDRFIGNQANVQFYTELKARHESVSAVACGNNEEHFNAMVMHMEHQEEKSRLLKRHHIAEGEGAGEELARIASAVKRSSRKHARD